jgi:cytoskeletal protein RodZ
VGANAPTWKWDWKYWEDAYNTGLQSIKKDSSKKKRRKQQGNSSSDSDSDDSTSTSTSTSSSSSDSDADSDASSDSSSDSDSDAGAGDNTSDSETDSDTDSDHERAARIAAAVNRDGTAASASVAELKLAAELAKSSGRGPAGRFGGREGKMARIRQQEAEQAAAMAAKLGIAQPVTAAAACGGKGVLAQWFRLLTADVVTSGSGKYVIVHGTG